LIKIGRISNPFGEPFAGMDDQSSPDLRQR